MMTQSPKPITGRKVALMFCAAFAVIIAVNLLLAFNAVSTFPGLEVRNSYVASQAFEEERIAQEALGWDVGASVKGETLVLSILKDGNPVEPEIKSAVFGRATNVSEDQFPVFQFDGTAFVAPIRPAASGNWNLRLVATAADGTTFKQRIVVQVLR